MLKYVLLFLMVSCGRPDGEPVEAQELKMEFENIWWDMTSHQGWENKDNIFCYYFDPKYRDAKPPDDGAILYHEEGDEHSYVFSFFQRIEGGYYIAEYDVDLEIFVDEYGNYSAMVSRGITNHKTDIVHCSLDL